MKSIILFILLVPLFSCSMADKDAIWPEISAEAKPWTRWWWLGSAVDSGNIERLLMDYSEKGLGGLEITPIYGVRGEEENHIDFLSEEWVNILQYTVEKASFLGMGVDMNTGTGWPFGGPQIGDEFAAKKMQFHHLVNISPKELEEFCSRISVSSEELLLALSAYNRDGQRVNLLREGASLDDIERDGREVMAVTQRITGQKVKRAAPGGEGLVFNHFSKVATMHYLSRFDDAFHSNPGVRCFFNDSYELSEASSVSDLFVAFEQLKGYDLALYTKELNGLGTEEEVARIKADYRDVLGEMLMHNFTSTWTDWAGKYGAFTRNQAHGSPGNLIDLYSVVDIPELETFHATDFPFLEDFITKSGARHTESNSLFRKFASSAAHMKGENLVSCESFTWLNEHFSTPLYQCKPELDEIFLSGITHLFFHGTAYSPERAGWPGWLFYASIHMEPNNPQWDHLEAMNEYIARCQSVLQSGQHTNDFLVFWSPDDYNHDAENLEKKLTLHNSESWVHMPEIEALLSKGYQFDFVTDRIIAGSKVNKGEIITFDKTAYQCIVVPQQDQMKFSSFKKLLQLADEGARVIFKQFPEKVSGFWKYHENQTEMADLIQSLNLQEEAGYHSAQKGKGRIFVGNIEMALKEIHIRRETLIDEKIKSISRKTPEGTYYFIANHENEEIDKWLEFNHAARNAFFLNPMNGEISKAESGSGMVHIQLDPGASMIVYFTESSFRGIKKHPYTRKVEITELSNPWSLTALSGGPELPPDTILSKLSFWTDLDEGSFQHFSGTCAYSTFFNLETVSCNDYLLRFEEIEASAKVFLNDMEVGILWAFPFELQLGKFLKEGQNHMRVEVSNLGSNRIRYLDQQGVNWKIFHDINLVNLDYEHLDASKWEVLSSGLSGKVEIIELMNEIP